MFALTPLERTSASMIELAQELVHALGATPKLFEPGQHDQMLAVSSHLPYLLASALFLCGDRMGAKDEGFWDLAGPGFRDTSRLAGSDVTMMVDILMTNKDHVVSSLHMDLDILQDFLSCIEASDAQALSGKLETIQRRRIMLDQPYTAQ
jgi:prephenate dehydrogenase